MMEEQRTILITPEQALKGPLEGIGRNRLYEDLLHREDFPSFMLGQRWFINAAKLQEWADKQCRLK